MSKNFDNGKCWVVAPIIGFNLAFPKEQCPCSICDLISSHFSWHWIVRMSLYSFWLACIFNVLILWAMLSFDQFFFGEYCLVLKTLRSLVTYFRLGLAGNLKKLFWMLLFARGFGAQMRWIRFRYGKMLGALSPRARVSYWISCCLGSALILGMQSQH